MARDEQILEAAEKLFYERSFDGVGVDEIGQAAGVSGSAIYRHFAGKEEILATLFDQAIDALLVGLSDPKDDPRDELRELVDSFVGFAQANRMLAGIWEREHRSLTGTYKRRYQRRLKLYIERWSDCLGKCYPGWTEGRLRTAIRAVQALMMSDATRSGGASSGREIGALLSAMALKSLEVLDLPGWSDAHLDA
ncbi:TetR/AcrR family transcriptional regulator [Rhodococcus olei]|uniref:TetR/AcrR family transcriptional regulator n=1 Tax=Rhodococcus olei TaxID=2161675 RepID=A0ABP8PUH4_9NOCA